MSQQVSSISQRPSQKAREVSLSFTGDAAEDMAELMRELKAESPNDVVLRAIGFLLEARGKEVLLRDADSGKMTAIEI